MRAKSAESERLFIRVDSQTTIADDADDDFKGVEKDLARTQEFWKVGGEKRLGCWSSCVESAS